MTDPFVGTLTFTRVYSGEIEAGSSVYNSVKGIRERIGRMVQMNANDRTDVKWARAGDIVAIAGLKDTTTGETLCDPNSKVCMICSNDHGSTMFTRARETRESAVYTRVLGRENVNISET